MSRDGEVHGYFVVEAARLSLAIVLTYSSRFELVGAALSCSESGSERSEGEERQTWKA
jgi:hypothetical protein